MTRTCWRTHAAFAVVLGFHALSLTARAEENDRFKKWEPAIHQFEVTDKAMAPPKDPILFVGSSTMVFWKLADHFPGLPVLNRGFGGSTMADLLHFFERVVKPYAPRTVVLYSGDNDLAGGAKPEFVIEEYKTFEKRVHELFPSAELIVLSVKPSVQRWKLWPRMQEVNAGIKTYLGGQGHCRYIDTAPTILDKDGQPKKELFRKDGLHLNEDGYTLWSELIRPLITPPAATKTHT